MIVIATYHTLMNIFNIGDDPDNYDEDFIPAKVAPTTTATATDSLTP